MSDQSLNRSVRVCLPDDARSMLRELSRILVGQLNLQDAQRALRVVMSREALGRCNGSRRSAAVLLGVDRRYVQRLAGESYTVEPEASSNTADEDASAMR